MSDIEIQLQRESSISRISQEESMSPKRLIYLVIYNVLLTVLFSAALIILIARSPYDSVPSDQTTSPPNVPALLVFTLITVSVAGFAGGALCNLRGLFKYYREESSFPGRLEMPFYIRPFTGALTGLFTFFLGHLLISSLSIDASRQAWVSLPGRLPYIAVSLLAGFASQEFMERLKAVAQTLFSQNPIGQQTVIENLRTLRKLLDDQLITPEEYDLKRKEILKKWR